MEQLKGIYKQMVRVTISMGVAKLSELCVDGTKVETADAVDELLEDGVPADKLPMNLADLEQRRTKLLDVLKQLDEMDEQRRRDGIDNQKNPAIREDLSQPVAESEIDRLPVNASAKRFDRSAFIYKPETDTYHCPAGKVLTREGNVEKLVIAGVETSRKNYRCNEC